MVSQLTFVVANESEPSLTMASSKPDVNVSQTLPNAEHQAIRATFRATIGANEAHATLAGAPAAPLFKIGELVRFGDQGGTILASAQKENSGKFVYEILPKHRSPYNKVNDVAEAHVTSSDYTIGDVVEVEIFGKKVRRTIEKVLVSAGGAFSYDVGVGYVARSEDVLRIVGRRR